MPDAPDPVPIPASTATADPVSQQRLFRAALILGAGTSLALLAAIGTQWLILGSIESGWWYHYIQPFSVHALTVGTLAGVAAASLVRLPAGRSGWPEWGVVLTCLIVAFALQMFVRSLTPFSFDSIFTSDGANSFYSVTQRYEPETVLGGFNRVRRGSALHAQSNMPGKVMLIYAAQLVSARTDVLPWLLVAISNLGGVLMYVFVRLFSGDRTIALYAMVLYLFVPAKLVFFPLMNTVTPVVLLASLSVLMWWLRTGHTASAVLLGVLLYAIAFFEPLPLVAGLVFAALSGHAIARGQISLQRFVLQASAMVLAFVATAETIRLVFGFDLVSAFKGIGAHAMEFNLSEGRRYAVWVRLNLLEFAFGAGMVQCALFVAALAASVKTIKLAGVADAEPLAVLTLSLLAVLIVTDLLGINRGEVVRLWIFLACLFQIPAAYVCARLQGPAAIGIAVFTSVVQAALATYMIGFIIP